MLVYPNRLVEAGNELQRCNSVGVRTPAATAPGRAKPPGLGAELPRTAPEVADVGPCRPLPS
ncbi:hypothetical protein RHCRD62_50220 [Rhodococcus sp. RD6.2]|nr:hypothetical protein RHCRD62_50220 [Rhodococcus sp. RD6.2]